MIKVKDNIQNIQPYVPGVLKEGAIKLASNENPLGASPKALAAIKKSVKQISLYPDGGCVLLKQKLADYYKVSPNQFIIGNGSDEIFIFIAGLVIEPGDEMLTSELTFSEYTFATLLFGGKPVYAPVNAGKYQLKEIEKRISEKTKVIFLANPNNPTGTYFNKNEFAEFMKAVPREVLVVIDEAYYEYVQANDYPQTLDLICDYENLLITRTFSKIYGLAGLRVGYAIGNETLINGLNKLREPFNVNNLAQLAAVAALDNQSFIKKSLKNNKLGKKYLYGELDKLNLSYYKTEANFIFVDIGMDCMTAFQSLMEKGVTIRPMKGFGVSTAIRVTIGTPEQNKKFIDCLKEVLAK